MAQYSLTAKDAALFIIGAAEQAEVTTIISA
jgi:hypothetical protein